MPATTLTRRAVVLVLLVAAAVTPIAPPASASSSSSVTGTISQSTPASGVSGATVTLAQWRDSTWVTFGTTASGSNGSYRFSSVPVGVPYRVSAFKVLWACTGAGKPFTFLSGVGSTFTLGSGGALSNVRVSSVTSSC
jgi:hypothetical protein